MVLAVVTLGWTLLCPAQSPQQGQAADGTQTISGQAITPGDQPSAPGSVNGTVVDASGAVVAGARVKLTEEDASQALEAVADLDGQFFFPKVAPGAFKLTITSAGLAAQTYSGVVHPGQTETIPRVVLAVAPNVTEVDVGVSRFEVAEEQIRVEEKQRVLGVIPNFYVTYVPNAAPLSTKLKFELAWKSVIDPFTFVVVGGAAGVEQWQNHFEGYGQGAEGYAKRFGAGYADTVTSTFIGGAILPALLKQDPRYFYKGTGSRSSRIFYAISMAVICKGDNGKWQLNYSGILGSLAAGGISNLYYPAQDRNGASLTFENAGISVASSAVGNLLQEFVIRKLTPKLPKPGPQQ